MNAPGQPLRNAANASVNCRQSIDDVRAICATFIADCEQGNSREIHEYVAPVAVESQPMLVRNLLHLDLDRQRAAGRHPDSEEYIRDLPEHASLIRQVFLESAMLSVSRTDAWRNAAQLETPGTSAVNYLPGANHLGEYRLLREIGRGGMGAVYEAVHVRRGERVALKTLPAVDGASLHRFKREFRAMAEINHPCLVGLHSLESDGGHWFFTMDLIEGTDFLSFVRPGDVLDVARLRAGLAQLVGAVLSLHSHKVIHRDLKPTNVMVTGDGRVVVLDFGLVFEEQRRDLSQAENVAGTPAYMAPEQALGKPVSGAADWYAVGVMLYEALSGRRPFTSTSAIALIQQKSVDEAPAIPAEAEAPEDLAALAMTMLARDPAQRPNSFDIAKQVSGKFKAAGTAESSSGTVLVGRERQLAELRSGFDAVRRSSHSLAAFVCGRSGEGKTSLIDHFLQSSFPQQAKPVVLRGRCYDRESVPFKALDSLIDALASHLRKLPDAASALLMPDDIGFLCSLFPVMQRVGTVEKLVRKIPAELDQQQVRKRAFSALRSLLNRTTQEVPVILVADDLQWGDSDSAEALFEALRPPASPSVLFIGSFRSDEVATSPFLTKWRSLNGAQADRVTECSVAVSPLTLEECMQLTITLVGQDTESVRRRAFEFHQETAGNPFLLTELIGCFDPASDSFQVIPINEVIDNKLARLPAEAAPLLDAIAVSGQALKFHEAALSVGHATTSLAVITHMRSEKLVRLIGGDEDSRVDTYHDKIRECVLDRMDPGHRRRLHRSLAEAIETTTGALSESQLAALETGAECDMTALPPRVFDLAYHFDAAGEARRACAYATLAAEQASQQFSQQAAAEQFAVARRNVAPGRNALRCRIARGEARALSLLGQYESAARTLDGQAELTSSRYEQAQIMGLQAEIAHKQGRIDNGIALYAAALRRLGHYIPSTNPGLVCGLVYEVFVQGLHSLLPKWCYRKNEPPSREESLAVELANRNSIVSYYNSSVRMVWTHLKGLNLAETRAPSLGLAYSYGLHPAPASAVGLCARGLRFSDIALEIASQKGDLLTRGHCYAMRSMAYYTSGQYRASVEDAERSISLLTQAGDPYVIFIAEIHAALSQSRLVEHAAAIEHAFVAFDRAVRLGEDASAGCVLFVLALTTNGAFPFRELRACFGVSADDHFSRSLVGFAEGIWHAKCERWDRAGSALAAAWNAAWRHCVITPYTVAIVAWLAMAQRRYADSLSDDPDLRRRLLRQAWRHSRIAMWLSRLYVSERPHALREHGMLLCHRGKTHAGLRQLRTSVLLAERQGDVWQHALSSLECGRIEECLGIAGAAERIANAQLVLSRVSSEIAGVELRCLKLVQEVRESHPRAPPFPHHGETRNRDGHNRPDN